MVAHKVSAVSEVSHRWPLAGLATVAALAPFNVKITTDSWTDLHLRLLVIMALAIVLALAVRSLKTPQWHRPDVVDSIAYSWIGVVWLSALLSDDLLIGAGGAVRISVAALLIPATRGVIGSRDDAGRVLRALAAGTAIGAVIGLAVWGLGSDLDMTQVFVGKVTTLGPFNRLTRPWSHANVAAMAMGASIASAALIRDSKLRAIALTVIVVAVVLTISRGGVVAVTSAGVAWVVFRRNRSEALVVVTLMMIAAGVFMTSEAWGTRTDQLGDDAFYESSLDVPASFAVDGSGHLVEITVTNHSVTPWSKAGDERVLISARWIGADDLIWTEDWWELPRDLGPGESVTTGLTIDARLPVGSYDVRWDLIIPRTAYFGQFLGDDPVLSQASITVSEVSETDVFRYALVEREVGLGRLDGWRFAWQDFTSSPLLGVGPNQFATRASSQLQDQQLSIGAHAHNVMLEPLATWGFLGTLPFLILGIGALVRSMLAAWRSRRRLPTAIAAGLIAVVVHGMVDWPLVTITTGIPVGLLVGLAWSELQEPGMHESEVEAP